MTTADTTNVSGKTHDSQISVWTNSWLQSRDVSIAREPNALRLWRGEHPGDDLLHDLVRAGIDSRDAKVGVRPRDGVFLHVAVAAEQLQALVDDDAGTLPTTST